MPKFLIVAATTFEVKGISDHFKILLTQPTGLFTSDTIDVLITGVGMVNTAYFMGKYAGNNYAYIINAGVCGAFNRNLQIGEVLNVTSDTISELGAEDGENFIKYPDMNLGGTNRYFPQIATPQKKLSALKQVSAITLNKVHGHEPSIQKTNLLFKSDIESMEGAAFFRGCENLQGSYFQLRAVSNYVEKRDKSKWNMPLAITNLNALLIQLINEFSI